MRMRRKIGITWANRPKRKMTMILVESEEIVLEASRMLQYIVRRS